MLGWDHIGDTCLDEIVVTGCFIFSVLVMFFYLISPSNGDSKE